KGFRVLVVDDSRAAREVLVAAMAALGSGTCDEAADGAEALKRFASGEDDLVVTDVHMPLLDGLKLIHPIRTRARHPGVPILVLTADGRDAERARALGAGASAFLSKPVGPEDVSRAAASLLTAPA